MKIDGEEVGYISYLKKNALVYNIGYHLANMKEDETPFSVIERVLTGFEFKKENS